MKKILLAMLLVLLIAGVSSGCTNKANNETKTTPENTSFDAVIDEVSATELLVTVKDSDTFNQARVNLQGITLDFVPAVGQTIHLTISPQVGMSEPPFVNPIEMTLIQ